jgi:hypothetical protein
MIAVGRENQPLRPRRCTHADAQAPTDLGAGPPGGVEPHFADRYAMKSVGVRLKEVVDRVRRHSTGMPSVNLARLNLKVGRALSRLAGELPDDPELVADAQRAADEILRGG